MMTFIDAAGVLADSADVAYHDLLAREARSIVQATVEAYDALAPKPAAWPDGAQWYTIDGEDQRHWHIEEPSLFDWSWDSNGRDWAGFGDIPIGVDWRLCKWQRPEVTP